MAAVCGARGDCVADTRSNSVSTSFVTVASAWLAGLAMLAAATSLVGIFVAPVAVPTALIALRSSQRESVRIQLLLGALALVPAVSLWFAGGPEFGTTTGATGQA